MIQHHASGRQRRRSGRDLPAGIRDRAHPGRRELFPVSSLGHSVLIPAWLGGSWQTMVTQSSQASSESSFYLAYIVALHCATALALLSFSAPTGSGSSAASSAACPPAHGSACSTSGSAERNGQG